MRHFLILACTLLLAACGRTPLQEQQAYVFGTRVEVLVVSANPAHGKQAIGAVLREFDRLHRDYHAWQPSQLSALNLAISEGRPQQVSPELAALLGEAQQLAARANTSSTPASASWSGSGDSRPTNSRRNCRRNRRSTPGWQASRRSAISPSMATPSPAASAMLPSISGAI